MVPKIVQHQLKIKTLLQKFLRPECPYNLNVYLEKWMSYFWRQTEVESSLLTLPMFTEWLVRAVTLWEKQNFTPPTTIASLTLNLAAILSKNEERFNDLNKNNFFIKLINVVQARQSEASLLVKSSYIKLLSSFLDHKSGVEWITVCTFWEDVLSMSLLSQDVDIVDHSTAFLSKMLNRTIDHNINFCNGATKKIIAPLGENIYKTLKAPLNDTAVQIFKPNLKLIGNFLVRSICSKEEDFRVALLFCENLHLEDIVILEKAQYCVHDLAKITLTMQFFQLSKNLSAKSVNASIEKLKESYCKNISKGCFDDVMEFLTFGYLYWRLLDLKMPPIKKNDLMTFSDQCLCLLVMPHYFLTVRNFVPSSELQNRYDNDEVRSFYYSAFIKRFHQDFYHIAYGWRDYLMETSEINQYCMKSLIYIENIRKCLTKEGILIAFHNVLNVLQDITRAIIECPKKLALCPDAEYFSKLFELLTTFIEEFHLTWKDCFEITNVMALSFDFLMLTKWPSKVVVKVLGLLVVATREFMIPNMALLGSLLSAELLDGAEIRVAALELIYVMARVCGSKFPSLQKVLMDSELPTLVVKMSTCDSESFVRATAIKCLQEMIQVEEIWNNALKTEDLPQKMRDVLLNETEGIVRVEAATFMCVAYENQQLPKETLDRVYETMIYSSTTDLHWEVKVRALDFWDKVIKNHLQNQGMIDGSFPNVTFSKEHRKIVTLTDSEIRKRLLKVLSQLSSIGCLGVLMSAIKDDCDMEVSKTAAKITQGLVDLFKKYNVRSDGSTPTSPLPTENGMSTASVSSGVSVDESMDSPATNHHDLNEEIIDQIVNSKDICLLKNVYTPSDYGSVSNYDIQVRRIVTPNEFLQFTQQDLNSIINEKKNWLNGIEDLGSLLDDMLKTYDDDVNNMDCY